MFLKSLLVVLVNYGYEQLNFLTIVVDELKSFEKYNVTVIVHSNIKIFNEQIDEVKLFKLDDYQLLPLTCRQTLWDNRNIFDLFIYGENDHLFKEYHLDLHLKYSKILPNNRISGLIQYEFNKTGNYYPGYHLDFDWDYDSVEVHSGKIFAHFTNVHQASFILSKTQILKVGEKFNFVNLVDETPSKLKRIINRVKKNLNIEVSRENLYSVKCKVNTDIYLFGGMKKMICISEFEQNLIHHLPNLYINGEKGRNKLRSDNDKMTNALNTLLNK